MNKAMLVCALWVGLLPETPVGPVGVGVSTEGVAVITVGRPLEAPSAPGAAPPSLQDVLEQLIEYFDHRRTVFDVPIDWRGMRPFSRSARRAAQAIPYGQTRTYHELAQQLNKPHGARAVGQAMARNPLPILIPCHRVVGADGRLRGFAGPDGIET